MNMDDINENVDENDLNNGTLPRTSTKILRPANCPSEPTTPTHADSKIKNESFHTCKTTVGSPGKNRPHKRTLRETPQRKAFHNGQTPFRESMSGRKLFSRRKQKSQNSSRNSHNDTFSLGVEQFSFDPDSLEAIRCSSVSTVSTFIMAEKEAAAAEEEARLSSPDSTRSLSPIRRYSVESQNKINDVINNTELSSERSTARVSVTKQFDLSKENQTEVSCEKHAELSREMQPDLPKELQVERPKESPQATTKEVVIAQTEPSKPQKEKMKAPKEIKPKKTLPTFQAPRPVRSTARTTNRTATIRATVMRPTNQTVTLRPNIPRRPLSTPSMRRQAEAFKSMAQLEREFERTLRTKEPGNAFSGQFMNQSTRFNMSTRLASSARKL